MGQCREKYKAWVENLIKLASLQTSFVTMDEALKVRVFVSCLCLCLRLRFASHRLEALRLRVRLKRFVALFLLLSFRFVSVLWLLGHREERGAVWVGHCASLAWSRASATSKHGRRVSIRLLSFSGSRSEPCPCIGIVAFSLSLSSPLCSRLNPLPPPVLLHATRMI